MGARKPIWLWAWMMYILIGVGMLAGCIPDIEQAEPNIVLDPISGGPGTSITVTGSGFPAETQVSIRLGPPSVGATPHSYGDIITDINGSFALSFTMPTHWPDDTPITETELVVVVLNEDGSVKATAPFGYVPSSSDAPVLLSSTVETHRQMILTWHHEDGATSLCSDAVVYESGYVEILPCKETLPPERRRLSEGATTRLHVWTESYRSFQVEQTTGTGANRVLTRITFVGQGSREVSETEVQMIQSLLEKLLASQ